MVNHQPRKRFQIAWIIWFTSVRHREIRRKRIWPSYISVETYSITVLWSNNSIIPALGCILLRLGRKGIHFGSSAYLDHLHCYQTMNNVSISSNIHLILIESLSNSSKLHSPVGGWRNIHMPHSWNSTPHLHSVNATRMIVLIDRYRAIHSLKVYGVRKYKGT